MVDLSATLIHHGHIRLLKKASSIGEVVVGLTSDKEILKKKGYIPELTFSQRKEILKSVAFVSEVVSVPWLINENILNKHDCDLLVHGDDNSNNLPKSKVKVFKRTKGISSTGLRKKSAEILFSRKSFLRRMLTPGPGAVPFESVELIGPAFGRGDKEFQKIYDNSIQWLKKQSGQDKVIPLQGSATLSIELGLHTFVYGSVLIIADGVYGKRLQELLPQGIKMTVITSAELTDVIQSRKSFDWIVTPYTETSIGYKHDIKDLKHAKDLLNAKLFLDATASIGLERDHKVADVCCFSSCKGLFGITGASFITHKSNLKIRKSNLFYFNYETHLNKLITGPYHQLCSIYGVSKVHFHLVQSVKNSKNGISEIFTPYAKPLRNQPLLCTHIKESVIGRENVVLYQPRQSVEGSIICHLGDIYRSSKYDAGIAIDRNA